MSESLFDLLGDALDHGHPAVLSTAVQGSQTGAKVLLVARPAEGVASEVARSSTGWTDEALEKAVTRDARAALEAGTASLRRYGDAGRLDGTDHAVFHEAHVPAPRLIIFGAVDFSAALARVGKVLGFHVVVCDAREVFATERRFPAADEVVVDWPQRHLARVGPRLGSRDAVCILTHDPKFDVPAAIAALATDVGYIGAMGSRITTEDRAKRLRDEGVGEDGLQRIMAPIGLDLGARTPEETAVAVCAEIIAAQTGRGVPSLKRTTGPIHPLGQDGPSA